ncbi:MAG TPA: ABC transporter ATP-binding protein, partial [Eubacteriales bacterium]|nr:ABC transporter ATP-binding protein [Eubacteriales bacterium]
MKKLKLNNKNLNKNEAIIDAEEKAAAASIVAENTEAVAEKSEAKEKGKKAKKVKEKDGLIKRLLLETKRIRFGMTAGSLLAAASVACALAAPAYLGRVLDELNKYYLLKQAGTVSGGLLTSLTDSLIILIFVAVLQSVFSYLRMFVMNNVVSRHFTCALRVDMSDKIARLPVAFVDKTQPGEVLSRMTNDVSIMGHSVHVAAEIIVTGFLQILAITALMFTYNWELALIVAAIVPLSMLASFKLGKRSGKHFDRLFEHGGKHYSCVEETYGGYMTIKAYNLEKAREQTHEEINEKIKEAEVKGIFLSSIVQPIIAFANAAAYVLICLLGGYFAISKLLSVGGV